MNMDIDILSIVAVLCLLLSTDARVVFNDNNTTVPLIAKVTVGDIIKTSVFMNCNASIAKFAFLPWGSTAKLEQLRPLPSVSMCTFVPDIPGTYMISPQLTDPLLRYEAMDWDEWYSGELLIKDSLKSALLDSDRSPGTWAVQQSSTSSTVNKSSISGLEINMTGPGYAGLSTRDATGAPEINFFTDTIQACVTSNQENHTWLQKHYNFATDLRFEFGENNVSGGVYFRFGKFGNDTTSFGVGIVDPNGDEHENWVIQPTPYACKFPEVRGCVTINVSHVWASIQCKQSATIVSKESLHGLYWADFTGYSGLVDGTSSMSVGLYVPQQSGSVATSVVLENFTLRPLFDPQSPAIIIYPIPSFFPPRGPANVNLGQFQAEAVARGTVDISLPPFSADGSMVHDSTIAIQRAVDFAYRNFLVVYVSGGRYIVTDTINCTQFQMTSTRSRAHVIRGQIVPGCSACSTKFVLPPSTPGFTNATGNLKALVLFQHFNPSGHTQANTNMNQVFQGIDIDLTSGNVGAVGIYNRAAQGSSIQDVTIYANDAYAGIAGGAGSGGTHYDVDVVGGLYGADYSLSQPVPTIANFNLTNQQCGGIIYCGVGAMSVIGSIIIAGPNTSNKFVGILAGACGVPAPQWFPGGPDEKCNLRQYPYDKANNDIEESSQVSLVDSIIDTKSLDLADSVGILTPSTVYLNNVYFRGIVTLVNFTRSTSTLTPTNKTNWSSVIEFAHADLPPPHFDGGASYQMRQPVYLNGKRFADNVSYISPNSIVGVSSPPITLLTQHSYGGLSSFPCFENASSVKDSPYDAFGDGIHDDAAAIQMALDNASVSVVFLPRGIYRISRTLRVPSGKALIGIAHFLTIIVPVDSGFEELESSDSATPLIMFLDDQMENQIMNHISLNTVYMNIDTISWRHTPEISGLDWQVTTPPNGAKNIFRSSASWVRPGLCQLPQYKKASWCPAEPIPFHNSPMVKISGDGLFFVVHAEDSIGTKKNLASNYRHLLITSSRANASRNFYHLNTEHAISNANTEILNANNVNIYGLKSEGRHNVLWIHNSSNVFLSGYGGNACPMPSNQSCDNTEFPCSLFRLSESNQNVTLANIIGWDMASTLPLMNSETDSWAVTCVKPDLWSSVVDNTTGNLIMTKPLDRPVLYKRDISN